MPRFDLADRSRIKRGSIVHQQVDPLPALERSVDHHLGRNGR
jgi:hypothetical protein